MSQEILPLAITMMAGPQIMSAIIFLTTAKPVAVSAAFLTGVLVAATIGTGIAVALAALLGNSVDFGDPSDAGSTGNLIQYGLIALLVLFALKNWRGRATSEPPAWLGTLQEATPGKGLKIGLLVILCMPSDIVIMLTVGANIEHHDNDFAEAIPFLLLTLLVAAVPLLAFLLFHHRALEVMPKVRAWMNGNSWLVNIIVAGIFIVLIVS
jgi:Sap, sulfolipid-1-addressing protein